MFALGELSPDSVPDMAEISAQSLTILWADDVYDGPLSGVAEWKDRNYRFEIVDRSISGIEAIPRRYWLVALSLEQFQEEKRWQEQ